MGAVTLTDETALSDEPELATTEASGTAFDAATVATGDVCSAVAVAEQVA